MKVDDDDHDDEVDCSPTLGYLVSCKNQRSCLSNISSVIVCKHVKVATADEQELHHKTRENTK